jgi:hypothetical protein
VRLLLQASITRRVVTCQKRFFAWKQSPTSQGSNRDFRRGCRGLAARHTPGDGQEPGQIATHECVASCAEKHRMYKCRERQGRKRYGKRSRSGQHAPLDRAERQQTQHRRPGEGRRQAREAARRLKSVGFDMRK